MLIKDKVVIITGASKGLGVAMAEICAAEGAKVVLATRSLDRMKTIENRIKAKGGIAHSVRCDMGNLHDLQVLIDETLGKFGAIHGLINNAGVNYVKPFLDTTEGGLGAGHWGGLERIIFPHTTMCAPND